MDMPLDRLRKWDRDELPPEERLEVGRWLLRSTDPTVSDILQGLIVEHEKERQSQ